MHRAIFWYLVAVVCAVVFFGVGTAASLNGTITSTAGRVGGIVISGAPDIVNGFRDGVGAGGGGNADSVFKTFDQQQRGNGGGNGPRAVNAQQQGQQRNANAGQRQQQQGPVNAAQVGNGR